MNNESRPKVNTTTNSERLIFFFFVDLITLDVVDFSSILLLHVRDLDTNTNTLHTAQRSDTTMPGNVSCRRACVRDTTFTC